MRCIPLTCDDPYDPRDGEATIVGVARGARCELVHRHEHRDPIVACAIGTDRCARDILHPDDIDVSIGHAMPILVRRPLSLQCVRRDVPDRRRNAQRNRSILARSPTDCDSPRTDASATVRSSASLASAVARHDLTDAARRNEISLNTATTSTQSGSRTPHAAGIADLGPAWTVLDAVPPTRYFPPARGVALARAGALAGDGNSLATRHPDRRSAASRVPDRWQTCLRHAVDAGVFCLSVRGPRFAATRSRRRSLPQLTARQSGHLPRAFVPR
jgi:hypothetical protein